MRHKYLLLSVALLALCPVLAGAQSINYKGETVELGPKTFLLDSKAQESEYVFNDFHKAIAKAVDGTAAEPMRIYIAPGVYWIDDPDDPEVRRNPDGSTPIGMTVRCNALQLLGLSDDPRDVVLGSARGQTQGSIGNFTMFEFFGDDLVFKDLTMGNYCNIDLEYPLDPSLNRPKRRSAITQAQLAFCHGDRVYAENVRFVSRLNLCPLEGAKRILFVGCHFESTDDSLNKAGVYLGCDFDFWGRQPFGSVSPWGSVFLDCRFNVCHEEDVQAISKSVGRHSLVDCDFVAGRPLYLAWTFRPEQWLRCYQYNITLDSHSAFVGAAKPYNTVCLDQLSQLGAYRLIDKDGSVLYNTFNLLRGEDDWDPQGLRPTVEALSERDGRDYANIPTCLDLGMRTATIQTGEKALEINAHSYRNGGYLLDNQTVRWKVQPGFEKYVALSSTEGGTISVKSLNSDDEARSFDLIAYTDSGLEAAVALTVYPDFVPAPAFTSAPVLSLENGVYTLDYTLDLQGRLDLSEITWCRSLKRSGEDAIPVKVSRNSNVLRSYTLSEADKGYYIVAKIAPRHLRCEKGEEVTVVSRRKVSASDISVTSDILSTDFSDFPCQTQTRILEGFWTVDAYKPSDTCDYSWTTDNSQPSWCWGSGINGAKGFGIQQLQQGARLLYTPLKGKYGDMRVHWQVDPAKDGGQGFASARQQYLDLYIKFDTRTLSGYALRVIRTTKYANAVDVLLVKYDNGQISPISESVTVDCFLTGCELEVWTEGGLLKAHVEGPMGRPELASDPNVKRSADLSAPIVENGFGGLGLQHTSTVGTESRILVHSVLAEWK